VSRSRPPRVAGYQRKATVSSRRSIAVETFSPSRSVVAYVSGDMCRFKPSELEASVWPSVRFAPAPDRDDPPSGRLLLKEHPCTAHSNVYFELSRALRFHRIGLYGQPQHSAFERRRHSIGHQLGLPVRIRRRIRKRVVPSPRTHLDTRLFHLHFDFMKAAVPLGDSR